jgi:hypothetical protein
LCVPPDDYALLLRAVREQTPTGATIYATFANDSRLSHATPVRFNALRPLVYSNKDRGMLVYSNSDSLQLWFDTLQASTFIEKNYDDENVMLKRHLKLARSLGARYLLTELDFNPRLSLLDGETVIYRNPHFALIALD